MKVITISGKAGSGKDTFANFLVEEFGKIGKRALVLHFADYLKFLAKQVYQWDGTKDEYGRTLLQFLGTNVARENNPNIWVKVVEETILAFQKEFDYFIIPDTRFPNEISIMNDSAYKILIKNLNNGILMTEEQKKHPSETALDGYDKFNLVYTTHGGDKGLLELQTVAQYVINIV